MIYFFLKIRNKNTILTSQMEDLFSKPWIRIQKIPNYLHFACSPSGNSDFIIKLPDKEGFPEISWTRSSEFVCISQIPRDMVRGDILFQTIWMKSNGTIGRTITGRSPTDYQNHLKEVFSDQLLLSPNEKWYIKSCWAEAERDSEFLQGMRLPLRNHDDHLLVYFAVRLQCPSPILEAMVPVLANPDYEVHYA